MTVRAPVQGRLLSDFQPGATFEHPWDVTVDAGAVAAFQAALLDAAPTYASGPWARALGFRDRPVHPLQLLVYACSFAQQDTSELAVAELGLEDVRFPSACYPGESLRAWSRVTDVGEASHDRGVVSLRTTLETDGHAVCAVTRKLLVPVGHNERRPRSPWSSSGREITELPRLPESLRDRVVLPDRRFGFAAFFEDFPAGDTILHHAARAPRPRHADPGRAVGALHRVARCARDRRQRALGHGPRRRRLRAAARER
jgi:2-methylfumaryl-CoA hydratase